MRFWWQKLKVRHDIAIVMLCPNSALVVFDHDGKQIPELQSAGSRTVPAFLRVFAVADRDVLFELLESDGQSYKALKRELRNPKKIESIFELRRFLREGATLVSALF